MGLIGAGLLLNKDKKSVNNNKEINFPSMNNVWIKLLWSYRELLKN